MKKPTFYGLAAFSGVCALICAIEVREGPFLSSRGCHLSPVDGDFLAIGNALKMYKINAGRPPTTAQGLDALVNEPRSGPRPRRWVQVMKKVPTDGWGRPYRYTLLTPQDGEWRWKLLGAGPDGAFGSSDDQVNEGELGAIDALAEPPEAGLDSRPSF